MVQAFFSVEFHTYVHTCTYMPYGRQGDVIEAGGCQLADVRNCLIGFWCPSALGFFVFSRKTRQAAVGVN